MRTITFSADEKLLEAAEAQARAEHTTLDEAFRGWLERYTRRVARLDRYDEVVAQVKGKLRVGRKLTRDEMNER